MEDELTKPEPPAGVPSRGRPWAGVLFSLFVPGFGFARGGHLRRAVAWFLVLEIGTVVVRLGFALEQVPFGLAAAAYACWVLAFLVMLYQSWSPGRMSSRRWTAFVGLLALTVVVQLSAKLVGRPFSMPTGSMSPTLQGASGRGDHVFVDRLTYRFSSPRRGDLLVFLTKGFSGLPQDLIYVKRVIGMPGERLEIRDGAAFANGTRLTEKDGIPPIRFTTGPQVGRTESASRASYEVPQASYFVVGDNPENSLDSRYFGSVPQRNVYGKVTAIYYPFSRAGRPRYPGAAGSRANLSRPFPRETNQSPAASGSGH